MTLLESEIMDFAGNTCFASLYFMSAYCNLPLDSENSELQSVMIPKGIMTPTRTLKGAKNSVGNFPSRVRQCFCTDQKRT